MPQLKRTVHCAISDYLLQQSNVFIRDPHSFLHVRSVEQCTNKDKEEEACKLQTPMQMMQHLKIFKRRMHCMRTFSKEGNTLHTMQFFVSSTECNFCLFTRKQH